VGDGDEAWGISAGEVLDTYWRLDLNSLWLMSIYDTLAWVGVTYYAGVVVYLVVVQEMKIV